VDLSALVDPFQQELAQPIGALKGGGKEEQTYHSEKIYQSLEFGLA